MTGFLKSDCLTVSKVESDPGGQCDPLLPIPDPVCIGTQPWQRSAAQLDGLTANEMRAIGQLEEHRPRGGRQSPHT